MATFTYTALDGKGRTVTGKADGTDLQSAKRTLKSRGIYVINISDAPAGGATFFAPRISTEDMVVAVRELATLISSGIPLDECLTGLTSQMKENRLKEVFGDVQRSIREGKSFSAALGDYPQYFSEMIISMVKAGEESGTLDMILVRVADFLEKSLSFKNKMLSIMTYPILMAVVAGLVIVFILAFVAPTITRIFKEISLALPLPTVILIGISSFLKHFWLLLIAVVWVLVVGARRALRSPKGIAFTDALRLRIPYLRDIFIKGEIAAFARTIATLLSGGVEILESFRISEKVVFSPRIRGEIAEIVEFLARGGSLSNGFQNARMFPYLVTQLVNAGEKSGNLPDMFSKIAAIYEEEVTQKSTRLVSFIEPVMILSMGAIVAFIVLAVLLPIFQISQSIR